MSRSLIKDFWEGRFVEWEELGARGTAGGVVMWDSV